MITERTGDGRTSAPVPFPFDPTPEPEEGDWVPLVSGPTGNNFGWVVDVTPFFIENANDFATVGPLPLGSAEYAAEFNQVKSLGRATGSTRNQNQTNMALFWGDNPPAMWTRIFKQVSENNGLSAVENARYFAMLYMTQGDALIACFADKARHSFWRPTTAIRMAASDGNPGTAPDTEWTALLPVPPYSDHPSGHNCASSSIVRTLRDFFGTNAMSFNATRTAGVATPITRYYTLFSQAINEIRLARVYSGLHFMTADAQGANLGRKVASYREGHFFQRV